MASTTNQRQWLWKHVAVVLLGIALLLGPSAPALAEALVDGSLESPPASTEVEPGEGGSNVGSEGGEVLPIALDDATVVLSADQLVYTGEDLEPEVSVTVIVDGSEVVLTQGTDYTVSYQDNVNVGTASISIVATEGGAYTGSTTATFGIVSPDKSDLEAALSTAAGAADGIVVSADGSDLEVGTVYVAQDSIDALNDAISEARDILNENNVTEGQVAAAVDSLNTAVETFESAKQIVPKPTVAVPQPIKGLIYSGSEQVGIAEGDGYLVEGASATNAGTHVATVSLADAEGTTWPDGSTEPKTVTFTIAPASITKASVTLSATSYTYDGAAKKPGISSARVQLVEESVSLTSSDYTVSYKNNINAGTGTVTLTGKGNFTGTVSNSFTIKPMSITGGTFTLKWNSCTYKGDAKKPAVTTSTVKLAGKTFTLKNGTHYTVSYKNNVNAGNATVVITGKGNFTGTVNRNLTIKPMSITGGTFTLKWNSCTYKGDAKKPAVKTAAVKIDGKTVYLKNGTHYTVSYKNNVNAGNATVVIKGKGNFTGTVNRNLTIKKANLTSASFTNIGAQLYTGKALKPSPTIKLGNTKLKNGTHFTVSYKNNTKVGKATATIKGKGNFYGTKTMTFTIYQRNAKDMTVASIGTQDFTGWDIKPSPKITYKGKTLRRGTDYSLSYKNNRWGGTATMTITGKGSYKGTKTVKFNIYGPKHYGYTVYITDTGYKYHRSGCRYLKHSKHAVDLGEALWDGYDACKVCRP